EKQRFLVGGQKVMKLDLVQPIELDSARREQLVGLAADAAGEGGGCDAAIIADFGLGLFAQRTLGKVAAAVRPRAGVMAGDVSGRRADLRGMRGFDLLCPSEGELREAYHLHDQGLPMVAWRLLSDTRSGSAIVTMGAEGLLAFSRLPGATDEGAWEHKLKAEHVPAMSLHAIDPLGCGDALLSAATLSLCAGSRLLPAAFLGAIAAAVQVQRLGNTVVGATELRHGVVKLHTSHLTYQSAEVIESRTVSRRNPAAMRRVV
ncbi:MAG: PfkB family carbohydrate kinase, partial [Phycisphaerales bacterium]